jgi:4-amino-4-deoxy-L-arabinose transferase-like glycosyltransferase
MPPLQWIDENRRIAIVGVLVLAAFLRFQGINQPYVELLAWREADTASMADAFASGHWNIFLPQVRWGGPGPNYIGAEFQTVSYIAALGYRAFGAAPWVGRMVSIAFGLWGIFALYQLVCRVWGTPSGIASAAVMAVLPGSLFIERSFLPDAAMTALMTTSLWMLITYCRTERLRYLVAAALTSMLGCLTKLPGGILVLPAIYAVISIFGPRLAERRIQLHLAAAAIVIALPVIAYYLWARHLAMTVPPYVFMGQNKFVWDGGLSAWLSKYYFVPEFWETSTKFLWSLPFIALAIVGGLLPHPPQKGQVAPWLFHAWLIAMVVRHLIEAKHLVTDAQNLHLFTPVIAAFAGQALVGLANSDIPFGNKAAQAFLSILIFCGATIFGHVQTHFVYQNFYRDHYILGRNVAELSRPTDSIITLGPESVTLYYSQRNGWVFPQYHSGVWDYGPQDVSILRELKAQGGQWLLIPSSNSYTGGSGPEFLRAHYPTLYSGIFESFAVVRELPEGLILKAK